MGCGEQAERPGRSGGPRALAEFATTVEVRVHAELNRSRETQLALVEAIRHLQAELDNRDQALAHVLERMNRTIDHSTECIEADRLERRTLVDAVGSLVRALPSPTAPIGTIAPTVPRERLVGGKVFDLPAPAPVVVNEVDLDLVAEERADAGVALETLAEAPCTDAHIQTNGTSTATAGPHRGPVPHRRSVDRRLRGLRDHPGRRSPPLSPPTAVGRCRDAGRVRSTRCPAQDRDHRPGLRAARNPWSRS